MTIADDLIYDLGAHEGHDTDYYLRKGFRVVAVEANPKLARQLINRFAYGARRGQFSFIGKAFAAGAQSTITLFVRHDRPEWSSIIQAVAQRDGIEAQAFSVDVVTLSELYAAFGVPRYMKIDLEGAEGFVLDQIAVEAERPTFLSVELSSSDTIARLADLGYVRFQLINQGYLGLLKPPVPAREGRFAELFPDRMTSGLFGLELEQDRWVDRLEVERQFKLWKNLRERDGSWIRYHALKKIGKWSRRGWLIGAGWMDVHACINDPSS